MPEPLKPCPFCGNADEKHRRVIDQIIGDRVEKAVQCTVCFGQMLHPESDPDINWNTRPLEDAARREALEVAKRKLRGVTIHWSEQEAMDSIIDKLLGEKP